MVYLINKFYTNENEKNHITDIYMLAGINSRL